MAIVGTNIRLTIIRVFRCSRDSVVYSNPLAHFMDTIEHRYRRIPHESNSILVLEGWSDLGQDEALAVEAVLEHLPCRGPMVCLVPVISKEDSPAFADGYIELGPLDDAQRLDYFSRCLSSCATRTAVDLTEGMLICDLASVYRFACLKAIDGGRDSPSCTDVVRAVAQLQRKASDVPPVLAGRPCLCDGGNSETMVKVSSPLEEFFGSKPQVALLKDSVVSKFGPGLPRDFHSILITGASGSGKTFLSNLLARAIGARSVLRLKASDILSSLVGASEAKLAKLLSDIRKEPGPFAILIDDVESLAPADVGSVSGTVQRLLVTLLQYGIDDAGWGLLAMTTVDASKVHSRLREKCIEVQLDATLDPITAERLYQKSAQGLPLPATGLGFLSPAEIVWKAREAACDAVRMKVDGNVSDLCNVSS
ncbi:hypothetical protein Pmar_PMAR011589 [Perkinsus marinus ATCC 50983]|uniref:AAA+ ATPase domain-containing protein n=1 Tax=Perkinsus marinus (strain ATCC 50983 / TXsc) TaxID=423536 RepID=C5LC78_PERM5|nr:hypothetical protein Pmar_PMAR011589 [Perkinsus marinus ATCC 50983]EER05561.1 hypothetical protein Pmar_PMAR011589 [Perkinsus marinus ATCC 50983]|eukprot:XP_002773745.1 hypothetical protein Pmar_PMAR011589 [Perkinsus marinus ATCC 50983]